MDLGERLSLYPKSYAEEDACKNVAQEDAAEGSLRRSSRGEAISCSRISVGDGSVRVCRGAKEGLLLAVAFATEIEGDTWAMG